MPETSEALYIFVLFAIAAVAVGVGLYVAVLVRRWAQREDTGAEMFTFQDLREMRDHGQIDQAEFEAMRTALLAQLGADYLTTDPAEEPPDDETPPDQPDEQDPDDHDHNGSDDEDYGIRD